MEEVVTGAGLQPHVLEAGMMPKQETVTAFLNLLSESLRARWGGLPSPRQAKLGLTMNEAILPGGKNAPLARSAPV